MELPIVFPCGEGELIGILHQGKTDRTTGVVFIVGGPQYRIGSHRQFVLMARAFAAHGYPVLRFDYRAMGDSSGSTTSFDDTHADLLAAIDAMKDHMPSVTDIVLLGHCDGASAALMSGSTIDEVSGMILINPWVRDEQNGNSKGPNTVAHSPRGLSSYWDRFKSSSRLAGLIAVARSTVSMLSELGHRIRVRMVGESSPPDFVARMREGFASFDGAILTLISGNDSTGNEFADLLKKDARWRAATRRARIELLTVGGADHTMSIRSHLDSACEECLGWLDRVYRRSS